MPFFDLDFKNTLSIELKFVATLVIKIIFQIIFRTTQNISIHLVFFYKVFC